MKYILLAVLALFFARENRAQITVTETTYDAEKEKIQQNISSFKKSWDTTYNSEEHKRIASQAGTYLNKAITQALIPFWYGTPWDFNGYTAIPNNGKIACGYFVSTVLQHAGFKLNRYKLAQKHALAEIKDLCCGDKIYSYHNTNRDVFISKVKNDLKDGLYVIGLDFHVGFLLKENSQIYFIHSNYKQSVGVQKEIASTSDALNDSRTFILTSITNNQKLTEKWIKGEQIVVQ